MNDAAVFMPKLSNPASNFGIESKSAARIRQLCERTAGLDALRIFGSRAPGDHRERSDIDFEADAPRWTRSDHLAFIDALKHLPTVYPMDCVWRQSTLPDELRQRIERDGRLFWRHDGPLTPPDRPSPPAV